MIPKIISVRYVDHFTVNISFADGTEGEVDLRNELYGELFEPLKNPALFCQVQIHPEFHTLCWPNGADFAPEFLYEKVQITA